MRKKHVCLAFIALLLVSIMFGCADRNEDESAVVSDSSQTNLGDLQEPSPTSVDVVEPETPDVTDEPIEWELLHRMLCESAETNWFEAPATEGVMAKPLMEDTSGLSLADKYRDYGVMIGTDINPSFIASQWHEEKLKSQFDLFTPSYELKPIHMLNTTAQELSQANGELTIIIPDDLANTLNWIKDNGKKLHGHTFCFWTESPEWFFREGFTEDGAYVSRETMLQRLESYISQTFTLLDEGGWSDILVSYDIVNEYLNPVGDGLNPCPFVDIIGEDYIYYAFKYAREFAPEHVKLVYNENTAEMFGSKRDAVLEVIKTLVDEDGNPMVDALGLQYHIYLNKNIDKILENTEYLAAESHLEIKITELDISTVGTASEEQLKKQGTYYYKIMEKVLDLIDKGYTVSMVSTCAFHDATSWLGKEQAPVLYDVNGVEKYSYYGMLGLYDYAGFSE